jgi:hypothetical protein
MSPLLIAAAVLVWVFIALLVVACCRLAAGGDAAIGVDVSDSTPRPAPLRAVPEEPSTSESLAREHVGNRA